jgi:hypothetical protein
MTPAAAIRTFLWGGRVVMWLIAFLVVAGGGGQPAGGMTIPADREALEQDVEDETTPQAVKVRVNVRNQVGRRWRLVEAKVALDDTEVEHKASGRTRELERGFSALETNLRPGTHKLTATLVYQRRGAAGSRVRVQTTYPFSLVKDPDTAAIQLVAHERGKTRRTPASRPALQVIITPGSGITRLPGMTSALGTQATPAPAGS